MTEKLCLHTQMQIVATRPLRVSIRYGVER